MFVPLKGLEERFKIDLVNVFHELSMDCNCPFNSRTINPNVDFMTDYKSKENVTAPQHLKLSPRTFKILVELIN